MPATTIRSPPSADDYVPLAEYLAQTPASSADGKPVLHMHLAAATASTPRSQRGSLALFPADMAPAADEGDGDGDGVGERPPEQEVDVFVGSDALTLFSRPAQAGVSIPYPAISIHAVKHVPVQPAGSRAQAVWMQLDLSGRGAGGDHDHDHDARPFELTIVPASPEGTVLRTAAQQLYDALSSCSDLHPDPDGDSDGDDGQGEYDGIVLEGDAEHEALEGFAGVLRGSCDGRLPPSMPGSGGWITADNAHEFFDGAGNWLGRAAARTRPRAELDPDDVNGHDGVDEDQDVKRPRVDE